jgi:subtilisin-like proprotein convertase family protein
MTRLPAVLTAALVGGAVAAAATVVTVVPAANAATGTFSQQSSTDLAPHRSFSSHDAAITIPSSGPASTYPAPIQVSGLTGTITDVDVRLNTLDHPFPSDLDVMLVGPGGQHVVLMSDAGSDVAVVDTTFLIDDEAPSPLPGVGQINTDRYRPTNYGSGDPFPAPAPSASDAATGLSAFDGTDPNGVWSLYVVDDTFLDSGSLEDGWSLSIDTSVTAQPYPSTLQVSGVPGSVTDVDLVLDGLASVVVADLDLLLVGPGGQRAVVMSDAGGFTPLPQLNLVLDDEAAYPLYSVPGASLDSLPADTVRQGPMPAMVSAAFRPRDFDEPGAAPDLFSAPAPDTTGAGSALSVFDGTDPNGQWRLFAMNDGWHAGGWLSGWSLRISTTDPAPPATPPATTPGPTAATDHTAPFVTRRSPVTTTTGVGTGATIRARFSEAMRRASLTGATVRLVRAHHTRGVPATVTYDARRLRVVLDPAHALRHRTTYRVVVTTAVKDLAGNRLDQDPTRTGGQPVSWTFRTG